MSGSVKHTGRIEGKLLADPVTKHLCHRLKRGEIAFIAHENLDRTTAESLAAKRVKAVINARSFLTGKQPADGAQLLLQHGIPMYEWTESGTHCLHTFLASIPDYVEAYLDDHTLSLSQATNPAIHLSIQQLTSEIITYRKTTHKEITDLQINCFISNTIDHAKREAEQQQFHDTQKSPLPIQTTVSGRYVVVVNRGPMCRADLQVIRPMLKKLQPLFIAVDGGADILRDYDIQPDLIIGDMDSISTEALQSGAELIVHAYPDGRAPGVARLNELQLAYQPFAVAGTSEDAALLFADKHGAKAIVCLGSHSNIHDVMEKGREGMGSTLLTRMRIGHKIIDLKGIHQLIPPVKQWQSPSWMVASLLLVLLTGYFIREQFHAISVFLRDYLPNSL
ncbi:putative cytokinetic ring protein SteA [Brevibacillus daliensis]|uniref:putative cytokinetic ring protein SteA n=1 Tax=Brevibacillus daliensis TaxID=2892995 RepID=UPI001E4421AF|nr:putative cytokinetic ring protein SteA [Brevibacillus daliensis]